MARCDACGSWVTPRYKRALSGNDGRLASCQHCSRRSVKRRDTYYEPRANHGNYAPLIDGTGDGE